MSKFNVVDVKEVAETNDSKVANKYLKLGWTLLNTHTDDYGHPVERRQWTVYSLGWTKDEEPKHPKGHEPRRYKEDDD